MRVADGREGEGVVGVCGDQGLFSRVSGEVNTASLGDECSKSRLEYRSGLDSKPGNSISMLL